MNLSFISNFTFNATKHYFSTQLPITLRLFLKNESHWWKASFMWTSFWISCCLFLSWLAGCSDEFQVVFKHFQNLQQSLYWTFRRKNYIWSKFHFQILWYSFTEDNRFLLTPSLIFPGKILPPPPLDASTTALVCIFSSILNSITEGWKYRSRELFKAIFCHQKK